MRSYYSRLVRYVFSLSWHSTDRIASVLGLFIPPIALLLGIAEADANHWIWEIPIVGFFTALVLRAFIAPYALYKENEKKTEEIAAHRAELQRQLDDRKPNLIGSIEDFIAGEHNGASFILATITVGNSGGPSIAQNWSMQFQCDLAEPLVGKIEWIPDKLQLFDDYPPSAILLSVESQSQPVKVIRSSEAIYNVAMTPIPRGGKILGYLWAMFPGISKSTIMSNGNKITVIFSDIFNSVVQCSKIVESADVLLPISKAKRFPGERV